jgi:malate dehydrogenase (oxaloacetate-decarboxylating)
VREVSHKVALEVAIEAQRSGLAEETRPDELERRIKAKTWTPQYREIVDKLPGYDESY